MVAAGRRERVNLRMAEVSPLLGLAVGSLTSAAGFRARRRSRTAEFSRASARRGFASRDTDRPSAVSSATHASTSAGVTRSRFVEPHRGRMREWSICS